MSQGDIYTTHVPVIAGVLAAISRNCTGGPVVLELGSGWGSTPLLHQMVGQMAGMLLTQDTDEKWLAKFKSLETGWHRLEHVAPDKFTTFAKNWCGRDRWWDLAFVDCAPGEMRTPLIRQLKGNARFIVAHDSERDYASGADYKYETIRSSFKYVTEYRFLRPYTLVLSDNEPYTLGPEELKWTPSAEQQEYFDKNGIKG